MTAEQFVLATVRASGQQRLSHDAVLRRGAGRYSPATLSSAIWACLSRGELGHTRTYGLTDGVSYADAGNAMTAAVAELRHALAEGHLPVAVHLALGIVLDALPHA